MLRNALHFWHAIGMKFRCAMEHGSICAKKQSFLSVFGVDDDKFLSGICFMPENSYEFSDQNPDLYAQKNLWFFWHKRNLFRCALEQCSSCMPKNVTVF